MFRVFLLAGVIFIPLERLLPLHGEQRTFRRWWRNDVIYVFANGALIRMGLGAVMVVTPAISSWLVPAGLRAVVARQPYWLQVVEAVILADVGFYIAHRISTASRGSGSFTRSITASRNSTGSPGFGCTRLTRW